ncbi:YeiH family protein [Aurantiacibacter marinus]|uniref:Membrane protein n=1 Tax=Aurantiacibacter marinus TaxID=874156 RepID=A0A0H0XLP6_9SPHN|nr:putative sulfate exporter family transporter [Aurantiacibacter marinus]KLI62852.1 membrane protein [Aurantiacibacter marinus]
MTRRSSDYNAGDLFGELYLAEDTAAPAAQRAFSEYVPGLLLCGTAALAAAWLASQYGFPVILLGLLIGLALSFVSEVEVTAPGLDFAAKRFLQFGIVLLGLQVTFAQVMALGWVAFGGLLLVMLGAFGAAMITARLSGQSREAGMLAGGATAICGASAALALYGVIGKDRLDQARFSVTLVGVAVASAIAMSAYPALAQLAEFSDRQAGFLIGASVHDAGQAIGGAFAYSDAAGRDGTVVKLARVAMLGPIVALVAVWLGGSGAKGIASRGRAFLPWFIIGFLVLLIANSMIDVPAVVRGGALDASKALLLLAVTATAMRSRLSDLLEAGWSTLLPVIGATLASFAIAFAVASLLL